MESYTKFWSEEKRQVAQLCEDKHCRLFYDNAQALYFVVKKNADGSILHTKETELFQSASIDAIRTFIKSHAAVI